MEDMTQGHQDDTDMTEAAFDAAFAAGTAVEIVTTRATAPEFKTSSPYLFMTVGTTRPESSKFRPKLEATQMRVKH